MPVRAAWTQRLTARAVLHSQAKALEFYDDAVGVGKGGTVGQRIDCALAKILLALVFEDRDLAAKQIALWFGQSAF